MLPRRSGRFQLQLLAEANGDQLRGPAPWQAARNSQQLAAREQADEPAETERRHLSACTCQPDVGAAAHPSIPCRSADSNTACAAPAPGAAAADGAASDCEHRAQTQTYTSGCCRRRRTMPNCSCQTWPGATARHAAGSQGQHYGGCALRLQRATGTAGGSKSRTPADLSNRSPAAPASTPASAFRPANVGSQAQQQEGFQALQQLGCHWRRRPCLQCWEAAQPVGPAAAGGSHLALCRWRS